jgi:UDP-GlcNAc:undecaprenyl-phosphate/decaprenyl-phosphate GlcNAc-1-phosphate transferase
MPALVAFIACSVLTPLFAHGAVRAGLVDRPSESGLKIHSEPKPLSGGISIVVATLTAIAVAGFGVDAWYASAVVLLLAVGVADDAVGLPPNLRLAAQGISGLLLAVGGLTVEPLGVLGPAAVVLGVPVLANAVNLTDGQDGLAAGLSLVATFGLWAIIDAPGADAVVSLALMGALLGFLIWNRPPASVFLGDGGAYVIGGVLVVIATRSSGTWASLLGSVLCVSIFALELVSTVIRRVTGPTTLVHGDRAHIYDQLARHLGGRTRATIAMWIAGASAAVLGIIVARLPVGAGAVIVLATIAAEAAAVLVLRRDPGTVLRRSR